MKALRIVVMVALLASAAAASAEEDFKFELHGFLTASMFVQDEAFAFGQGQGLLFRAPSPTTAAGDSGSGSFVGADLRQSRFALSLTGPQVYGATPRAYVETDMLSGYQESVNVRVRQAFAELKWANTVLEGGQYSAQLVFALLPQSVAHIANPVTSGLGSIGSRGIGFRAMQTVRVGDVKLEFAGEVLSARWNESSAGTSAASVPLGWSTNTPYLGARVKAFGKAGPVGYYLYAAGAYESVNLKGLGNAVSGEGFALADGSVEDSVASYVGTVGARFDLAPMALLLTAHAGQALAPFGGAVNQYGAIGDVGYWAQLGANVTKELSVWALYGAASFDEKDVLNWRDYPGAAAATTYSVSDNEAFGGMVRYQKGPWALALEYTRHETKYLTDGAGAPATYANYTDGTVRKKELDGSQYIASMGYFF